VNGNWETALGAYSRSGKSGFFALPVSERAIQGVSRATVVGLAVNVLLAALKAAAGLAGNSRALLADAVHTVSDLATDAAVLVGVRYWAAPADAEHPHGHHKIETLVTFTLGLILATVGIGMGWRAAARLVVAVAGPPVAALSPSDWDAAALFALFTALFSIAAKEVLYRWTVKRGVALASPAVIANAWHHRSDALSSIPPALSIALSGLASRFGWKANYFDDIGALLVCVLLLQAAWEVARPALCTLLDASADRRLNVAVRREVLTTPGVSGAHHIRTRVIGGGAVEVDLHIAIDPDISVREGHRIAAGVKYRVLALPPANGTKVVDVMVHMEPLEDSRERDGQEGHFPGKRKR
jgi:cation diffusion facilitator family transporter